MTDAQNRRHSIETLTQLIKDMPVAMLTTCLADHSLRSRPMVNVNSQFDGDLWFFTSDDDPKVEEVQCNPQVNVSFSEPSQRRYVSIAGTAHLVRDPKHAEILWTQACQRWFTQGLQDPTLALLKIDIQRAEYWDQKTNVMHTITGLLKTNQPTEKHDKIDWEEKAR